MSAADLKLGLLPPIAGRPALEVSRILTGVVPAHPVAADHIKQRQFGLYGNDQFGDCGPTGVANYVRLVSRALTGAEVRPSQADVFTLYSASNSPAFNPLTGANDNGVVLQVMLEKLMTYGIGDGKGGNIVPLAFAKASALNDAEVAACVSIFGATLWGINLLTAQQGQTDAKPPKWTYVNSPEWGGHCVLNGEYDGNGANEEVISWDTRVQTDDSFRSKQLQEVWIVIWSWNVQHPAFQAGVNLGALKSDYGDLTGKTLNISV